jgi:ABC-type polysaccharide/polyol phosphate export permease
LDKKDLVKQVRFSTILLPTHVILSAFLHELIAMVIFVLLLVVVRHPPSMYLLGIITLFPLQLMFTLGLSLIVAAFAVFYKDVRELVVAMLTLWFFATPIIYPLHVIPDWFEPYFALNPMTPLITAYRTVLLGDVVPDMWGFVYFAVFSLALFFVGIRVFTKMSRDFADLL